MAQTQLFSFGVKGGLPAQVPLGKTSDRTPFLLGPTVNIRVLPRLSIETGVTFHRFGQQAGTGALLGPGNSLTLISSTEHGSAIELPILAKYHFRDARQAWRPFVALGPAIRRTSIDSKYGSSILSGSNLIGLASPGSVNQKTVTWGVDPSVAAGVDFKAARFHLEPQIQYSYWGAGKNLPVRKNQVSFQFGFRF